MGPYCIYSVIFAVLFTAVVCRRLNWVELLIVLLSGRCKAHSNIMKARPQGGFKVRLSLNLSPVFKVLVSSAIGTDLQIL